MASVLVLDDQAANRELLSMVVASAGHTMIEASAGEEALQLTRNEHPDLVIADILMPGMDGYEFVRQLRRDPRVVSTRVVFYTATYIEDEARRLATSCGVEHFLVKPCEPEEILEVVALALGAPSKPSRAPIRGFDREHLRVVNDTLIAKVAELEELDQARQQLNERLRSSELQYRLLFERNPLPMLVYDRKTLQIVAVNRALVGSYGYSADELVALTITDLLPSEDIESLLTFLAANPGGVQPSLAAEFAGHTWRHRYKDATIVDVEVTAANLTLDGRDCRIALYQNVTERKRWTAELESARDEAVRASSVKSAFLANISHEIRTPMNGVIAMNELLLDTALTDEQRLYTEQVARSGAEMMELIGDMLDIAKIEAGTIEVDNADFDLLETLELACVGAAQRAKAKGVKLEHKVDPAVPRRLHGNARRLQQVLQNLVANAVKFTDEGAVVVRVNATRGPGDAHTIRCEVTDTGIGIDPAAVDRMFEPFTQADASSTRRFGGTGLGLAIAKELTAAMGGTIGAESSPGSGSTFWFELNLGAPVTGRSGFRGP